MGSEQSHGRWIRFDELRWQIALPTEHKRRDERLTQTPTGNGFRQIGQRQASILP